MSHKFASVECIGARIRYIPTGATGTIIDIQPGKYYDHLVIQTDGHGDQPGIEMVRSVEDCAIAFKRQKVALFDRVTVFDFDGVVTGIVVDLQRNYLMVRSEDDGTFWDVTRRFVAKVEKAAAFAAELALVG